jgi:biopolymer transport protein ExbB
MNLLSVLSGHSDGLISAVAWLLLLMSVASWVVIVRKSWLLRCANTDVPRCIGAFWQAAQATQALHQLQAFDRAGLVIPLVLATQVRASDSLAATANRAQQLTRLLRDALQLALRQLQAGQVLLATVGATAPFVGLLGTVWGIYHALVNIGDAHQLSVDKIAGPIGEALIMTAAGLAVAIPAVLAYNILGRAIARIALDLEGFAHDLHALASSQPLWPAQPEAA